MEPVRMQLALINLHAPHSAVLAARAHTTFSVHMTPILIGRDHTNLFSISYHPLSTDQTSLHGGGHPRMITSSAELMSTKSTDTIQSRETVMLVRTSCGIIPGAAQYMQRPCSTAAAGFFDFGYAFFAFDLGQTVFWLRALSNSARTILFRLFANCFSCVWDESCLSWVFTLCI